MAAKKKASVQMRRRPSGESAQLAINTDRLDRIEPVLEKIMERLDSIELSIERNKGFWGAVTLIGGAITAALTAFKDDLLRLFGQS